MRTVILALATAASACSVAPPPTAPSSQPVAGVPARLELSAVSGTGAAGGTVAVQARVLDAYAGAVPNVAVAFQTTAGELAPAAVATDLAGVARTTLTAPAGVAAVVAQVGPVRAETTLTVQPLVTPPAPPPPSPPPPLEIVDPIVFVSARRLGPLAYRFTVTFPGGDVATRELAYTFADQASALGDVVVRTPQRTLDHAFAHAGLFVVQVEATLANGRTISTSTTPIDVQP